MSINEMEMVQVHSIKAEEVLKKPVVMKFWSPVKECNCVVTVRSVSPNSHWTEFKYRDVRTRKWVTSQCQWNCLGDAMDDAYNDVRLWSTEA